MLYFNSCLIVVLLVISNFSSLSNASSTSAALRLNEMVVTKAMQSPEVFTNVMSELKDVALTLKTGQEEDAAMTARVKDKCDNSVFRVKHALEMIEKDCGGLSSQEASVEKQIQSLSATRDPLVSSPTMTKSIGASSKQVINSLLLETKRGVPVLNDLPKPEGESFNDEMQEGERLLNKVQGVSTTSTNSIVKEQADAVKDLDTQLARLRGDLKEIKSKRESREKARVRTVNSLKAIMKTCKVYHKSHETRSKLRSFQAGTISTITNTLKEKLEKQLQDKKDKEQTVLNSLDDVSNNSENVTKAMTEKLNQRFNGIINATLQRAGWDAFTKSAQEKKDFLESVRKQTKEVRRTVVKLQKRVVSNQNKIEVYENELGDEIKRLEEERNHLYRDHDQRQMDKVRIQKDEKELEEISTDSKSFQHQIQVDGKRLSVLIAASKLRQKIAAIFAMAYADTVEEINELQKQATVHKINAQMAIARTKKYNLIYEESQKKIQ
jgi:hypothetical protein